jgi:hypothetical protein
MCHESIPEQTAINGTCSVVNVPMSQIELVDLALGQAILNSTLTRTSGTERCPIGLSPTGGSGITWRPAYAWQLLGEEE